MEKTIMIIMVTACLVLSGYTLNLLSGTHQAVSKTVHMFMHN